MRKLLLPILMVCVSTAAFSQEVTGLAGWNIYLDPGHSQKENMGAMGWSEAEHALRVALFLREMLLSETDIDTVYMSRTDDHQNVRLQDRTAHANEVAADFYYSIHSDAPATSEAANRTLFMYGGWRQDCQTVEKTPQGGALMGEHMDDILSSAMRLGRRGNIADRVFYQGNVCDHANRWPYLHVNRVSNMASLLSEAGFHTVPTHNMRQMNSEYQKLQARAAFWTILRFHNLQRPSNRIATGFVRNIETGHPINGATISIGDREYTTDSFESLFHRFTNDPDLLRNGFFYFEELNEGELPITVTAEGYHQWEGTITLADTVFTFVDPQLIPSAPPQVLATDPASSDTTHRFIDPITIDFSRRMDRVSVQEAFSIEPAVTGVFAWGENDSRLTFTPDSLTTSTWYTVTIAETAQGHFGDGLDGNADGEEGGDFVFSFRTGPPDITPPRLVAAYPSINQTDVELRPVITLTYDEPLHPPSVDYQLFLLESVVGGDNVEGDVLYHTVREHGIVSYFPASDLAPDTEYRFSVAPGISDIFGNETTITSQFRFTTGSTDYSTTILDDFEGSFTSDWWEPQASGSTGGIVTEETGRDAEAEIVNRTTGSTQSMRIRYGWDLTASSQLIRIHVPQTRPPASITFGEDVAMQAYVFGDGGGSQFAFSVRDARASNAPIGRSPWYTVDWRGWRLITWDLGEDPPAWWAGDGEFGPPYRMESLQMRYVAGAEPFGAIYVDDLRLAEEVQVSIDDTPGGVPVAFRLHGNHPNPFQGVTTISFDLPSASPVDVRVYNVLGAEVARLVQGETFGAGTHDVVWDASGLSSGVYIVHIVTQGASGSQKVLLVR